MVALTEMVAAEESEGRREFAAKLDNLRSLFLL
jgi:hypothetical protein